MHFSAVSDCFERKPVTSLSRTLFVVGRAQTKNITSFSGYKGLCRREFHHWNCKTENFEIFVFDQKNENWKKAPTTIEKALLDNNNNNKRRAREKNNEIKNILMKK
jgi:hypothetical protein